MFKDIICLIFLDIDGVINNTKNEREHIRQGKSISSYKIKLPREQILNLKEILNRVPNCRIILSSSWRLGGPNGLDMKNLTTQLAEYNIYIDDVTPNRAYKQKARGIEIYEYIQSFYNIYGYEPPYIILDDNIKSIVPYHRGHIVYCNPRYGLDQKGVNISINLLLKQLRELKAHWISFLNLEI